MIVCCLMFVDSGFRCTLFVVVCCKKFGVCCLVFVVCCLLFGA